jgi:hypothetical protein
LFGLFFSSSSGKLNIKVRFFFFFLLFFCICFYFFYFSIIKNCINVIGICFYFLCY